MANDDDIGAARTKAASRPPPLTDTAQEAPTLVANRYAIVGLLGVGGMGRVYRAHDRKLDEVVALKMLRRELVGRADMLERFRQEVKLARRVTSPHVVRTFDLGEHGEDAFLTMEYIEGRSLAQRIEEGPMPMSDVLRIASAIAAGIAAAHATGVLHRDLKPDNVLVGKDGRIAITDFGIARPASGSALATQDRFVGTPAYMAPEQIEGAEHIGPAVDVYAFGGILFELVTGRRPFVGNNLLAIAAARLTQPAPDPRTLRSIPDATAELILRCLEREPGARYADGSALEVALRALQDTPVRQSAPSLAPPVSRPAVPDHSARLVAIAQLRATGDLVEIADGLGEEIGDTLSMSRGLRVRPLGAMRARAANMEAAELGRALGVDVVIEGSVRRRGALVRITARAISVADEFQLWASHVDAQPDGLLSAGDELVRAIAAALTVDIAVPARPQLAPHVAEAFLEAKAQLRTLWVNGRVQSVITALDQVLPQAPDDPSLLAVLAMALARSGFFGNADNLSRAVVLADRAIAIAPSSPDAQLARAFAALYSSHPAAAAAALARVVKTVPGQVMAQGMLGGLLLEAGTIEDAITHLEAAAAIDPATNHLADLARGYCYLGRFDDAIALLMRMPLNPFIEYLIARLELWRGRQYTMRPVDLGAMPEVLRRIQVIAMKTYATGVIRDEDVAEYQWIAANIPQRFRAAECQYIAEAFARAGRQDDAIAMIRTSVDAGLNDIVWFERCPLLEPLRDRAELGPLADVVRQRADAIGSAIRAAVA